MNPTTFFGPEHHTASGVTKCLQILGLIQRIGVHSGKMCPLAKSAYIPIHIFQIMCERVMFSVEASVEDSDQLTLI